MRKLISASLLSLALAAPVPASAGSFLDAMVGAFRSITSALGGTACCSAIDYIGPMHRPIQGRRTAYTGFYYYPQATQDAIRSATRAGRQIRLEMIGSRVANVYINGVRYTGQRRAGSVSPYSTSSGGYYDNDGDWREGPY